MKQSLVSPTVYISVFNLTVSHNNKTYNTSANYYKTVVVARQQNGSHLSHHNKLRSTKSCDTDRVPLNVHNKQSSGRHHTRNKQLAVSL